MKSVWTLREVAVHRSGKSMAFATRVENENAFCTIMCEKESIAFHTLSTYSTTERFFEQGTEDNGQPIGNSTRGIWQERLCH